MIMPQAFAYVQPILQIISIARDYSNDSPVSYWQYYKWHPAMLAHQTIQNFDFLYQKKDMYERHHN